MGIQSGIVGAIYNYGSVLFWTNVLGQCCTNVMIHSCNRWASNKPTCYFIAGPTVTWIYLFFGATGPLCNNTCTLRHSKRGPTKCIRIQLRLAKHMYIIWRTVQKGEVRKKLVKKMTYWYTLYLMRLHTATE